MEPVDPCVPLSLLPVGCQPIIVAKNQQELYNALPSIVTPRHAVITRWTFNDVERRAIAQGEDLYLTIYGTPIRPVFLSVGVRDWTDQ